MPKQKFYICNVILDKVFLSIIKNILYMFKQ